MSSAKRNPSSTSVCTLDLACNLLRLKSFPSKRYLIGIPLSPSWKASVSMAENIMLNSVEASTQPCLTPFVTGNGSENSPSFWTLASTCSSLLIASSLIDDGRLRTPSKCSAHLFKIVSLSVRRLVPSALRSGVVPELWGPYTVLSASKNFFMSFLSAKDWISLAFFLSQESCMSLSLV